MRPLLFVLLIVSLAPACVVGTEPVRGKPGPTGSDGADGTPGEDGQDGKPGPSTFLYSDNMTDIYYLDGKVGIGIDEPTSSLHVTGNAELGGELILTQTSGPKCSEATCSSRIQANGGASENYNGLWLASNERAKETQSDPSLSSWAVDIGGVDNINYPNSNDTFRILRRPPTGQYTSLFTIATGGSVGIGTDAPLAGTGAQGMEVESSGSAMVAIDAAEGTSTVRFETSGQPTWELSTGYPASDALCFYNYQQSPHQCSVVLGGSGNVGIGTLAPESKLDVHGGAGVVVTIGGDIPETALKLYGDSWTSCADKPCPLAGQDGWLKVRVGNTDHYMPLFP